MPRSFSKSLFAWLGLLGAPVGLQHLYLHGWRGRWWQFTLACATLGLLGWLRTRALGLDDPWAAWLLPLWGLSMSAGWLYTIALALMPAERWNERFNPQQPPDYPGGQGNWTTVLATGLCLFVGTIALLSSLAFGFQRYFEMQVGSDTAVGAAPDTANTRQRSIQLQS